MGTITHFRNLYVQAFENCKPIVLVAFLKVYSVFCALMIFSALYAFVVRAANGFDF
ncbi:hypothetical protein DFQ03_3576 [Maribacter caenipelagi]|uniref:Uncharacterized protein n=1 Tax=Maribacter caenipelagi TaxID=1447781 RepID=A0A4R7CTX4_9FLAO|nr:DUF6747 family protein [Maribacter caenipelagi]TDS11550.1 hypothetical protein DFQ03_3576 [Maribacter caenipelagi]